MSFVLALFMSIVAVLAVLVLAATASFPVRALTDDLSPEGEWAGPARLPQAIRRQPPTDARQSGPARARRLKGHSWI